MSLNLEEREAVVTYRLEMIISIANLTDGIFETAGVLD